MGKKLQNMPQMPMAWSSYTKYVVATGKQCYSRITIEGLSKFWQYPLLIIDEISHFSNYICTLYNRALSAIFLYFHPRMLLSCLRLMKNYWYFYSNDWSIAAILSFLVMANIYDRWQYNLSFHFILSLIFCKTPKFWAVMQSIMSEGR